MESQETLPQAHPHFSRAHPSMGQQAAAGSPGEEQELMSSDLPSAYTFVPGPFSVKEKECSAGRQKPWGRISRQHCCGLG